MRIRLALAFIASIAFSADGLMAAPRGGPPTVGQINVMDDGFDQTDTNFAGPAEVYFLEINYDGVSPLTINTRSTTDPVDTEIGLYDATGVLIDSNDDIDFGQGNLLSEIRLESLPAGQYFLAVGLFNTVFGPNFDATSTSGDSGNVVVRVLTDTFPVLDGINNIALNYNFNGIVHADEPADPVNNPDDPNGFRSISDRALDFRDGIPSDDILDRYILVASGGELDIVHLGNRDTVDNGNWMFDDEADLDCVGIQPDWLLDVDQTGRQTTVLDQPIPMNADSQVTVLFQISNGGGSFDVVVGFADGSEFVGTVTGPDWFGPFNGQPNIGIYPGAFGTDCAFMDTLGENTLLISEAILDLGSFAGNLADSVAFENATNPIGGVAILAVNLVGGEPDCLIGDVNQDGKITLLDVDPFVGLLTQGAFQCEADINQDGAVTLLDVGPFVDLLSGG